MTPYAAVVLAGGSSRRMQVPDKTRLAVGGQTLLDRVLTAVSAASTVVVVGEPRPTVRPVRWTLESPPGGGPAKALAAGVADVREPVVVALAGDLPFLTAETVAALVAAVDGDGAVVVDGDGQHQWLCSAWRTDALRTAAQAPETSLRSMLGGLRFARLPDADAARAATDCDTPEDLRRAEETLT